MSNREPAASLYRHARREAILVMLVWALALVWTLGYCYLHGYRHAANSWVVQAGLARPVAEQEFRQVAGLPEWVTYGILAPWLACTAVTIVFALFVIRDDDLGTEAEERADGGH